MSKYTCPEHNVELESTKTKYGTRWGCPEDSCTVVCWGGKTSTPANLETRNARKEAHGAFDELWRTGMMDRNEAYEKLAEFLDKPKKETHIGMFDKETCDNVLAFVRKMHRQSEDGTRTTQVGDNLLVVSTSRNGIKVQNRVTGEEFYIDFTDKPKEDANLKAAIRYLGEVLEHGLEPDEIESQEYWAEWCAKYLGNDYPPEPEEDERPCRWCGVIPWDHDSSCPDNPEVTGHQPT
jgi:hypothetical protein